MTWTRNGHREFVRVSRVPRANSDRSAQPSFGPVRVSRICDRVCETCPEHFKVNSRSKQKLCPSCARTEEVAREGRRKRIAAVLARIAAEQAGRGPRP
jgi:hypothetical protein